MGGTADQGSGDQGHSRPARAGRRRPERRPNLPAAAAGKAAHPEPGAAPAARSPPARRQNASAAGPPWQRWRRLLPPAGAVLGLAVAGYLLVPWLVTALSTVSTDDAYVNGHVTFVAPRVPGQVARVLVDDNYRVRKGDLLVELDKEPYQVQVAIKQAAVATAKADLALVRAQVRGIEAQARSQRFKLEHTIEAVDNQIALLRAKVADLQSKKAVAGTGPSRFSSGGGAAARQGDRPLGLRSIPGGHARCRGSSQRSRRKRSTRSGLPWGCRQSPPPARILLQVPPDLDQTFSAVRQAQADLIEQYGAVRLSSSSFNLTPKQMIDEFFKQNKERDIDRDSHPLGKGRARRQAGRGEAHASPARPGPCRTEPPLLQRRQRDRRRRDRPQRQSRQQRPGGAKPDGRPLVDGNLDRRQFQGDPTGRPAHRSAGALRGGHVRPPAGVRGPHHGLHHGDRSNPRLAAAAERHGQLREDRAAAARPHRADRLQPGQGPRCSSDCR